MASAITAVGELGYPTMEQIVGWSAIYGPPNLPDEVVAKWVEALQFLGQDEEWLRLTNELGNVVDIRSPEDTRAFVKAQYDVFDQTLLKLGLRVE